MKAGNSPAAALEVSDFYLSAQDVERREPGRGSVLLA
jgi:hypothetical protein